MSAASRRRARQWLSGLTRYLDGLRKRLREGPVSQDSAARIAAELDALLELRQQAEKTNAAGSGGKQRLEYDETLLRAFVEGWGRRAKTPPW